MKSDYLIEQSATLIRLSAGPGRGEPGGEVSVSGGTVRPNRDSVAHTCCQLFQQGFSVESPAGEFSVSPGSDFHNRIPGRRIFRQVN